MDTIRIRGARTHNLKNIDLDLPRDKLIVITGLSGSGKSSLAFDTIYAEGQRRYVESLSAYARQFLSMMDKPDVDHIEGLSPAIAIEQKATSHNPRSTVGTITEIYDYLRLLFARVGTPRCPDHGIPLEAQTVSQMVDQVLALDPENALHAARADRARAQGRARAGLRAAARAGFRARARRRRACTNSTRCRRSTLRQKHTIEAVIDRFRPRADIKQRLAESFETALRLGDGIARRREPRRCRRRAEIDCSRRASPARSATTRCRELEPRLFSFNSPVGACPACDGLGVTQFFDPARVVVHPHLSASPPAPCAAGTGATQYYFQLIQSLARALQVRHRHAVERPAGEASRHARAVRQRRRADRVPLPRPARRRGHARATASKASCRTSSGATRKPNRRRCARNSRSSSATRAVPRLPRRSA